MALDYSDRTDFEDADRGLVASIDPVTIKNAEGRTVFDLVPYEFLNGDRPDTVNPSLWRQAQLCIRNGLFEVTSEIYQIRGFDISNMTIIEGDTGVVIVDPLVSAEVASAGLALYREHRGDRPVSAVIYTHCHPDHFGGVLGVLPDGAGNVPIVAPAGFMEHAVAESVYAGTAMNRRATFQYGNSSTSAPMGWSAPAWGWATRPGRWGCCRRLWTSPTPGKKKPSTGCESSSRSPRATRPPRR